MKASVTYLPNEECGENHESSVSTIYLPSEDCGENLQ